MFTKVQIFPAVSRGNLIQWTLTPDVQPGYTVDIFRSRSGVEFELLATVADSYFFVDTTLDPTEGFEAVYRLVLNHDASLTITSFLGALPIKDRNTIRAIRRREVLGQDHGGGRPGFLLKRRTSEPCKACSGAHGNESCGVCFGTGYVGGYYRPVRYNASCIEPGSNTTKKTSELGTTTPSLDTIRGLVYPVLEEGDVWVEQFTDRRFFIIGKTELTYRGVPIIYSKIELSMAPALHPVYRIKVTL